MTAFIARRLILLPFILLGVTMLIFFMVQFLTPTQRLSMYISSDQNINYSDDEFQALIERYGLNDPIFLPFTVGEGGPLGITYCECTPQYLRWLGNVLQGNLGWSETDSMPVMNALITRFPATMELALLAIIPLIFIGISLGIVGAVNHNLLLDHVTRFMSISGFAFPVFVFGLLMLMFFYGMLEWFPPDRLSSWATCVVYNDSYCEAARSVPFSRYTGLNTIDALMNGRFDIFVDSLKHIILPVVTLSYVSIALIMRITRSSMLETLRQDYVMVARAKGQKEAVVVRRHATRNALIPVATISGLVFAGWMGGVVITETIFNYKGLGKFVADAAASLDIPSVLGFTLFATSFLVLMNLVVDLLYAFIDPRVRLE